MPRFQTTVEYRKTQTIQELATHGNVSVAMRRVGMSRPIYYHWRRHDADFCAKADAAIRMFKTT